MIDKIKYRFLILRVLAPFSVGVKRFLLLNLLISLLLMGLGFLNPLFYKLFINDVILHKDLHKMPFVITGYVGVFTVSLVLTYAKNYCTNRIVNRVTFRVKLKILQGFFARPFQDYDTQSVGDRKMRLNDDTACVASYAGKQTTDYVISYTTLLLSAILLFFIEWRLAIFSCVSIPLTFFFDHIIAKRESVLQNSQRDNDQKMESWLHASVQGWHEIKALNLQKHEERRFNRYIHQYAVYFGTWINYWVVRVLIIPKIKDEFLMQFCLYFFGGLLIIRGEFQIGSLLVFMQYHTLLSDSIKNVSGTDAELIASKPQSDRMLEELSMTYSVNKSFQIPDDSNNIEFKNVSFTYPGAVTPVIADLSFHIRKGERIAITGKSGCGKTTVLKLILGMLQPVQGQVLLSDTTVNGIPLNLLHRRFCFVMQDNILFNASIRDNLRYGKIDASDLELEAVLKEAYIWDFIAKQQEGLDTVVGERGIKLSGGQKQRIVLARQLLHPADIYIFDEATSALDQYSESMIHEVISNIGKDKTIIIVAHRKNSLNLCDRNIALT